MNLRLFIRNRCLRTAFCGLLFFCAQYAAVAQTLLLNTGDKLTLFDGETLSADVAVGNGAVLTGEGVITGAATVSGLLDPGLSSAAAGTLTVGGGVTFNSDAVLRMHLFTDGSSDRIDGADAAFTLNGTLKAVVPAGYSTANRSFTVMTGSAGLSGSFTNVTSSRISACLADDSQPGELFSVSAPDSISFALIDYKAEQTITNFQPVDGSVFLTTNAVTLSAEAASGLAVAFAVTGGPGSISGGTNLTFSSYGTVLVVASQSGDANWSAAPDVTNRFTVHGIPAVGTVTLQRAADQVLKVTTTMLLENTADPEGSALTVVWVSSSSTNGGAVALAGRWVTYMPPEGNSADDFFQFCVRNTFGGEAVGTVKVQTAAPVTGGSQTLNFKAVPGGGNVELRIFGIPGRTYVVQGATRLIDPNWTNLSGCVIGAGGYVDFTETNPPSPRYYRTVQP